MQSAIDAVEALEREQNSSPRLPQGAAIASTAACNTRERTKERSSQTEKREHLLLLSADQDAAEGGLGRPAAESFAYARGGDRNIDEQAGIGLGPGFVYKNGICCQT